VLPVFILTQWGMGLFCFCFTAKVLFVRKVFWDGCWYIVYINIHIFIYIHVYIYIYIYLSTVIHKNRQKIHRKNSIQSWIKQARNEPLQKNLVDEILQDNMVDTSTFIDEIYLCGLKVLVRPPAELAGLFCTTVRNSIVRTRTGGVDGLKKYFIFFFGRMCQRIFF
jgi:hypothetical protein